ncbi:MAG: hypothetical protein M1609_07340 [Firmicutes bacterium]|nr:hypothetical protein [Bacillota bacterium]
MKDQERIDMFYRYGAMDWRSEEARANVSPPKKAGAARGLRLIKLASLLWAIVLKNVAGERK